MNSKKRWPTESSEDNHYGLHWSFSMLFSSICQSNLVASTAESFTDVLAALALHCTEKTSQIRIFNSIKRIAIHSDWRVWCWRHAHRICLGNGDVYRPFFLANLSIWSAFSCGIVWVVARLTAWSKADEENVSVDGGWRGPIIFWAIELHWSSLLHIQPSIHFLILLSSQGLRGVLEQIPAVPGQ